MVPLSTDMYLLNMPLSVESSTSCEMQPRMLTSRRCALANADSKPCFYPVGPNADLLRRVDCRLQRLCQCDIGSPATGDRKYGRLVPSRLPRYTVRRSGPPKVRLAIHGARLPLQVAMISGVMVPS